MNGKQDLTFTNTYQVVFLNHIFCFLTHFKEFMQFLLLYKYGGIYNDFDSVLLQLLPSVLSADFIGVYL